MNDRSPMEPRDLIISAVEINDHHGVGILLRRFFPENARMITLRSRSGYGGEESFGGTHWELPSRQMTLSETEERLRGLLAGATVRRILAVPYYREDFIHALLAKRITGADLCVFIMDDQNVFTREVPDPWVEALLKAADLALGISPELCEAYALKYGVKPGLMPPVLPPGPAPVPNHWIPGGDEPFTCAMIGNVWTKHRFEKLRSTIRGAGIRVHWYGNGPKADWLAADAEALERDGIRVMGFVKEEALCSLLGSYPLVLVPSGTLDGDDDNPSFSRLSLPSRILFLATRASAPVLVLGGGESAAGRFVRRLRIGNCCGYTPELLWAGIRLLTDPKRHPKLCRNLRACAPLLTHADPGAWIWESLTQRKALSAPWEKAFRPRRTWYGRSLEKPPQLEIAPAKPRTVLTLPERFGSLKDADLPGFGYTRQSHIVLLEKAALVAAGQPLELVTTVGLLVGQLALALGKPRGDWLSVGTPPDGLAALLPPECRLWRIQDVAGWQSSGCPVDGAWYSRPESQEPGPAPTRFEVILSNGITNAIHDKDTAKFDLWARFLREAAKPGALQVHGFTALLNMHYYWKHPLHEHMVRAFSELASQPALDDLLSNGDLWWMEQEAYNLYWKPQTKRTHAEFGRALGLILGWRNA